MGLCDITCDFTNCILDELNSIHGFIWVRVIIGGGCGCVHTHTVYRISPTKDTKQLSTIFLEGNIPLYLVCMYNIT